MVHKSSAKKKANTLLIRLLRQYQTGAVRYVEVNKVRGYSNGGYYYN